MPANGAGRRNRRVRIERPVADTSLDGAGSGTWELVKEVWAEVQDALPSRDERVTQGFTTAARRARVRILHRTDVDGSMRFVLLRKTGAAVLVDRTLQIIAGPAFKIDTREDEFMVEDYSPAGNPA